MSLSIADSTILNNGVAMPWLGIGTWQSAAGRETEQSVAWALELGYRHIDTAALYANEADVGRGPARLGDPQGRGLRHHQGLERRPAPAPGAGGVRPQPEEARPRARRPLSGPLARWPAHISTTWRVLEELHAEGRTRAIGVSNYLIPPPRDAAARRPGGAVRESSRVAPVASTAVASA